MAALPYMPLYVADYLADAAHLSTIEHGAYLLLIMNYWQRGEPLPNDDTRLARIAGLNTRDWKRHRDAIAEFFTVQETHWRHGRIDSELSRVAAKSLKSKKAAQASVQRRFNGRSADVEPTDTDTDTDTEKKMEAPDGAYAFAGKVVRLKPDQFGRWKKSCPDLDLTARLQQRDDWLSTKADEHTRKNWFIPTSNWLANLQQKAAAAERAPVWDGMP